jgi:acylphosphatase
MHRLHLIVHGRVQGVGFRWYVVRRARELGVAGWVRNLPGGEVEIEAEGDPTALGRLRQIAGRGPQSSRVTSCDESMSEGPARFDGFTITG